MTLKVYNYTGLAVSAIVAKIDTVQWTVEILRNDTLKICMCKLLPPPRYLLSVPTFVFLASQLLYTVLYGCPQRSDIKNIYYTAFCVPFFPLDTGVCKNVN